MSLDVALDGHLPEQARLGIHHVHHVVTLLGRDDVPVSLWEHLLRHVADKRDVLCGCHSDCVHLYEYYFRFPCNIIHATKEVALDSRGVVPRLIQCHFLMAPSDGRAGAKLGLFSQPCNIYVNFIAVSAHSDCSFLYRKSTEDEVADAEQRDK